MSGVLESFPASKMNWHRDAAVAKMRMANILTRSQGSGHGARQVGSLDRLTWLFVALGRLLLALGAQKLM